MKFQAGNKAGVGHGRPKNKFKDEIEKVFADYNPLQKLKEMAEDEETGKELRFQCRKELAQYYAPKLKAVEHSGDVGLAITHDLAIAEMAKKLEQLEEEHSTE